MKTVYIDISMVMIVTKFTGVQRVVLELGKRICYDKELTLVLLEYNQKRDCYEIIDTELFLDFCKTKTDNRRKMRTGCFLPIHEIGKECESAIFFDVDAVWNTRVRRSWLYPVLKENHVKIVPFIHDIICITHPHFCPTNDMLNFIDFTGAIVNYADEIILTSHTTDQYVTELYRMLSVVKPKTHIAPLGGDLQKKLSENRQICEKIKGIATSKPYLLMVGTIAPRKNHKLLVDAYENGLKELGINLVIAGFAGWDTEDLMNRIYNHPDYNTGIFHLGDATDEEIDYLYEHCFALAYPSYIEGYGLPLMESFVNGVLIFAADTAINKEIAGELGIYFKLDDPESLVKVVKEYMSDTDKYQKQKKKIQEYVAPTWEECADKVCRALRNEEKK